MHKLLILEMESWAKHPFAAIVFSVLAIDGTSLHEKGLIAGLMQTEPELGLV